MTAPDTRADLDAQHKYVPLILTGAMDGYRVSFGGGETVADFKSLQAGGEALREAELLVSAWVNRVRR